MPENGKKLAFGMTQQQLIILGVGLLVVVIAGIIYLLSPARHEGHKLSFGGGPVGGTFIFYATAMSTYVTGQHDDIEIFAEGSGGSTENLRRLNSGEVDFGIVYGVDAALGRRGSLPHDTHQYRNVRVMSYLYGAPAQLVAPASSEITSPDQLAGMRVAVGNAGSGAAAAAERFFRHIGLWEQLDKQNMGYSRAAQSLNDGRLDAFWILAGYPTAAVIEAASRQDLVLLNVGDTAVSSGFYQEYAYTATNIPADTYPKQPDPVRSFQDNAMWMANVDVPDDVVYRALEAIYSPEGLAHMIRARSSARSMTIPDGLKGASVPVHPGAIKFWSDKGIEIPSIS